LGSVHGTVHSDEDQFYSPYSQMGIPVHTDHHQEASTFEELRHVWKSQVPGTAFQLSIVVPDTEWKTTIISNN
jgi:hypothetical protein